MTTAEKSVRAARQGLEGEAHGEGSGSQALPCSARKTSELDGAQSVATGAWERRKHHYEKPDILAPIAGSALRLTYDLLSGRRHINTH